MKAALCYLLGVLMIGVGVAHFVIDDVFLKMMPPALPWHLELVYLSGVFEILGGIGLMIPQTRRAAAIGCFALFVAVYPANLYMAFADIRLHDGQGYWANWIRLPFQFVLFAWAWWFIRDPRLVVPAEGPAPASAGD